MSRVLFELAGREAHCRFSPHCWKAHLALEHKGIDFELRPVRYHEIPDTLNFIDYRLLPVLNDHGTVVADSWEIACFLEEHHDGPALFSDAADKALAGSINHWCDTTLAPLIRPLIIWDIYQLLHKDDQAYFRESREAKLGMTLEAVAEKGASSLLALREELESARDILSLRDYLSGHKPGYADICLLSTLMWMTCVRDIQFVEPSDRIASWYHLMLDTFPSAKKAVDRAR